MGLLNAGSGGGLVSSLDGDGLKGRTPSGVS